MSKNVRPLTTEHLRLMCDDIAEFVGRAETLGDVALQGVPIDQR